MVPIVYHPAGGVGQHKTRRLRLDGKRKLIIAPDGLSWTSASGKLLPLNGILANTKCRFFTPVSRKQAF
jgi:hypothetical protein